MASERELAKLWAIAEPTKEKVNPKPKRKKMSDFPVFHEDYCP